MDTDQPAAPLPLTAGTRAWFAARYGSPTEVQRAAWPVLAARTDALVVAPTGSGKTLAAFLVELDSLLDPADEPASPLERCRVLYISPLRALATDIRENLLTPLADLETAAQADGRACRRVTVGLRTSDTPATERRQMLTSPPDILVTTPESLYLMLTSNAQETLRSVRTVIIDEIHALAGTKRGAHLAVSLERLADLTRHPPVRIGLSATVAPLDEVARFLSGAARPPARVVAPPAAKHVAIDLEAPVTDMADLGASASELPIHAGDDPSRATRATASVWPAVEERVLSLVLEHRTTLVFTQSRQMAEKLAARLNERWLAFTQQGVPDLGSGTGNVAYPTAPLSAGAPPVVARAHHGSLSQTERHATETALREGRLRAVVATASLELGIDMGEVDLVIQVGAPMSVSSGLQRIGRAGHHVNATSHGVVMALYRADLVATAVICEAIEAGAVEPVHVIRNPLDVLAQQFVAMVAARPGAVAVSELAACVRRSVPFADLTDGAIEAVLAMLSGYAGNEDASASIRPRLRWDPADGTVRALPGAALAARTSAGTIPDRGLFGVYLARPEPAPGVESGPGGGGARPVRGARRVGELDEEMVYESRVGDVIQLGASNWRIVAIGRDRVEVVPAGGSIGRLPFWKGDSPGRPAALGRRIGRWLAQAQEQLTRGEELVVGPMGAALGAPQAAVRESPPDASGVSGTVTDIHADPLFVDNLTDLITSQLEATGTLPTDRTILVELTTSHLGDAIVVIHSVWGARVNVPWAEVLRARLEEVAPGSKISAYDDGIVISLAPGQACPTLGADDLAGRGADPDELMSHIRLATMSSGRFMARFREAAARSLVLPRSDPARRQPLWQQRLRATALFEATAELPNFPVALEALREAVNDDLDVPSLMGLLDQVRDGSVAVVTVTTSEPSPFTRTVLGALTAENFYAEDSPAAERAVASLAVDPALLDDLLGPVAASRALAGALDPDVLREVAGQWGLAALPDPLSSLDRFLDALRRVGPVAVASILGAAGPVREAVDGLIAQAEKQHAVILAEGRRDGAGALTVIAVSEDAGLLAALTEAPLPRWVPESWRAAPADPLAALVRRRTRAFLGVGLADLAASMGLDADDVERAGERCARSGAVDLVDGALGELLRDATAAALRLGRGGAGASGGGLAARAQRVAIDRSALRVVRRRSLAASAERVEPVSGEQWAALVLRRGHVLAPGADRAGLRDAIAALSGSDLPLATLDTRILPARVVDYEPWQLDDMVADGEVTWVVTRAEWDPAPAPTHVRLVLTDQWDDLGPEPQPVIAAHTPQLADAVSALRRAFESSGGGAWFFPRLAEHAGIGPTDPLAAEALWHLVCCGLATGDRLPAVRDRYAAAHRPPVPVSRSSRSSVRSRRVHRPPVQSAPTAGRWQSLVAPVSAPAQRALAGARLVLERFGIADRSVVRTLDSLDTAAVMAALTALARRGEVERGYFVEALSATQFATTQAVDAVRHAAAHPWVVLDAADPAQPYGGVLPWPALASGARAARRVGAAVALRGGELVAILSASGRHLDTVVGQRKWLAGAASALVAASRANRGPAVRLADVDGVAPGADPAVAQALGTAGLILTPQGWRSPRRSTSTTPPLP